MKNLCKRLHMRSYDSPVKIGKEIAQRLEEVCPVYICFVCVFKGLFI